MGCLRLLSICSIITWTNSRGTKQAAIWAPGSFVQIRRAGQEADAVEAIKSGYLSDETLALL
jgi:hypothetical protein